MFFKFLPKFLLGVFVALALVVLGQTIFEKTYSFPKKINYGVSFSPEFAKYLNLDWQKTYLQMIDELKVKDVRLPTYWTILEPKKGEYNFSETDYLLDIADKKNLRVVLVVGVKQPRWPECHMPEWVSRLNVSERHEETLKFITKVLQRYENRSSIWAFQVENEPLLPFFGDNCGTPDNNFLAKEVETVRSLTKKTIIVSDSGEFGFWTIPMKLSDIFGTTMYRKTYDPLLKFKTYPILPYFYNLRSSLTRSIFAKNNQKTIVIELQAEPWLSDGLLNTNAKKQTEQFPLKELQSYVDYFKKTGFDTAYLWGVEWWYFMAKEGYPQYLDYAKTLFN